MKARYILGALAAIIVVIAVILILAGKTNQTPAAIPAAPVEEDAQDAAEESQNIPDESYTFEVDIDDIMEDRHSVDEKTDQEAAMETIRSASAYGTTREEGVVILEEYLRLNPDSSEKQRIMQQLASYYQQTGLFDEARDMHIELASLPGNERAANALEINLIYIDIAAGDYDIAEEKLLEIIERPEPQDFSLAQNIPPHLFAPRFCLAEIREKQCRFTEADEILKETATYALRLARENPDNTYLPPYVYGSYKERINLLFASDLDEKEEEFKGLVEKAQRLVDECNALFPEDEYPGTEYRRLRLELNQSIKWHVTLRTQGKNWNASKMIRQKKQEQKELLQQ